MSPPTTIADLVALVRGAAVIVSGDTGPTHIAAAVGTPIVGIYGPTRPARNGPWSADDVTVSRDAICQCHHLRRSFGDQYERYQHGEVARAVDGRFVYARIIANREHRAIIGLAIAVVLLLLKAIS